MSKRRTNVRGVAKGIASHASVDVDATLIRGGFTFSAALSINPGERVGLIGPNGSGKSTLLSALAGHLQVSSGSLSINGSIVDNGSSRMWVPPHRRDLGWLGSTARVFPHMTVRANVAYGLKAGEFDEIPERTQQILESFQLTSLADQMASKLSTGQQCRVALARAFAVEPAVLVLDEPFTGLDVRASCELRSLIDPIISQRGTTVVLVSHDLVDLTSLVSRIIVLDKGQIIDDGRLPDVFSHPRSEFVADLAGVSVIQGTVGPDGIMTSLGLIHPKCPDQVQSPQGDARFSSKPSEDPDRVQWPQGTSVSVAIPQDGLILNPKEDHQSSTPDTHTPENRPLPRRTVPYPGEPSPATENRPLPEDHQSNAPGTHGTCESRLTVSEVSMSQSGLVLGDANGLRLHLPVTSVTTVIRPGDEIGVRLDDSKLQVYA